MRRFIVYADGKEQILTDPDEAHLLALSVQLAYQQELRKRPQTRLNRQALELVTARLLTESGLVVVEDEGVSVSRALTDEELEEVTGYFRKHYSPTT